MAGAWLLLAGLFQIWGGVAVFGEPPPDLRCPLLARCGSRSPRGALLRLLGGPGAPPHPETPQDPQNTFDVIDTLGVLPGFWGPSLPPPRCELSPTEPLLPPPPGPSPRCHPGLGTRWWLLALGTPRSEGTVLLQEVTAEGDTARVNAPPQVSLLPSVLSPGVPARLRCDAVGFFPLDVGIRWERQARGDPRPRPVTPEGATTATPGDSASSPGDSASTTPGDSGAGLSWSSGHRRAANGTFSRSAGLSVAAGTAGDSYSCLVTHAAWDVPLRVTVHVAGDTGPSVEDVAGMALVAFVIGGLCQRLWPSAGR